MILVREALALVCAWGWGTLRTPRWKCAALWVGDIRLHGGQITSTPGSGGPCHRCLAVGEGLGLGVTGHSPSFVSLSTFHHPPQQNTNTHLGTGASYPLHK